MSCNSATAAAPSVPPPPAVPDAPATAPSTPPPAVAAPAVSRAAVGVSPRAALPNVALRPVAPDGWAASLIVSGQRGAVESGPVDDDGQLFVSWAVTNHGPDDAAPFSVDLLVDGVPVERWAAAAGLKAGDVQTVRDWAALPERVRLSAGPHELSLVVDSTGYVQPLDAAGNTATAAFDWPARANAVTTPAMSPERLPNLAPYLPQGWADAVRLQGVPTTGDAVVNPGLVGLQIAYHNAGLSSVTRSFLVYVYVDGILVTKFNQGGLIADEAVVSPPWRELLSTVRIAQGPHTLTLQLDPTDLVDEADETDNVVTVAFHWGAPSPFVGAATPPSVAGRLSAYTPTGWTRPLVVAGRAGDESPLNTPHTGSPTYVSWALANTGAAATPPYEVTLLIDGREVATWQRPALAAGAVDVEVDGRIAASSPAAGIHAVDLRVRLAGAAVDELASRTARWRDGAAPAPTGGAFDADERRRRLAALEDLRSSTALVSNSPAARDAVVDVVDLVYRALYGRSLAEQSVAVNILTDAEYDAWVDAECADVAPALSGSVTASYLSRCAETKGFAGYYTHWRGAPRIVVKGERAPMQVMSAIAHELGHFRQAVVNPSLNGRLNLNVVALREAQAYAHQSLFFRTLESLTGLDLLLYPRVTGYESYVATMVAEMRRRAESSEHARGRLVLWLALLSDADLRQQRTVLLNNRSIPAPTAREVYDHLVSFTPSEAQVYVEQLMRSVNAQLGAIESLVSARLIPGLPYWNEGSPALRDIGLLLP